MTRICQYSNAFSETFDLSGANRQWDDPDWFLSVLPCVKSIYFLLMIGLTLATRIAFDYLIQQPPSDGLQDQKKVLGALSAFFNAFVLYYHASRPPTPGL